MIRASERLSVLVIGGSGFIGTRLVDRLVRSGHRVKILDSAQSRSHADLLIKGDVRSLEQVRSACAGADVVYNLAAEHRDDVSPESRYHEVNVVGAENTCKAATANRVRRIIFTSSVAVYAPSDQVAVESSPVGPGSEYGRTKLAAEGVYQRWLSENEENRLIVVRPTVVFGEGNRGNVYSFMKLASKRRFIMIGSGGNRKSMAYVENVAGFLEFALTIAGRNIVVNYTDGPDLTIRELVEFVRTQTQTGKRGILRVPLPVALLSMRAIERVFPRVAAMSPVNVSRILKFCANTQFSCDKARSLGFVPEYGLLDGLTRTLLVEFGKARY